jgi:predicted RNA-binding protein with PIN domain
VSPKQEHLLIDGYNLIKSSQLFHRPEQSLEKARLRLQRGLDAYVRRAPKKITVYYDGNGDGTNELAKQSDYGGIHIVFSHAPETADDLIMRVAQDKHGAKWLRVVSSDREIRHFVERHKIRSTRSEDFLDELEAPISDPTQSIVQGRAASDSSPDELDEWERLFANRPPPARQFLSPQIYDGTEADPPMDKKAIEQWQRLFQKNEHEEPNDQGQ